MLRIEEKDMPRTSWRRVIKRAYTHAAFDTDSLCGAAGLIRIEEVTQPLFTNVLNQNLKIADRGYYWLQIAPQGRHWWLSVMLDEHERILQYYFDITLENTILPDGNSRFRDLFLDVVLTPDGRMCLMDQDELDQALNEGVIGSAQYALAEDTARAIMNALPEQKRALERFCRVQFDRLKAALPRF